MFTKRYIYLDWAAATPVLPSAELAFVQALRSYGNPSSPHAAGVRAKELLEDARTRVARLLETKASGIVFTSGATEANNLAIAGHISALRSNGQAAEAIHVLYLPTAHASVVETVDMLKKEGIQIEALEITSGSISLDALRAAFRPETRLVIVDAVCGETGTVYDARGVRNVLDAYAREHGTVPAMLHVDASQAPLALPVSLTRFEADSMALDAQKIGGVRGFGVLARRDRFALQPVQFGGGQEGGLRPGTESPALAQSFAAALEEAQAGQAAFSEAAQRMRDTLLGRISSALPDMLVNVGKRSAAQIINLSFPGRDTDYLVMLLDRAGFAVATKSACETDSAAGSRAVLALTQDEARARATLRISFGPATRAGDLDRFAEALIKAVRFLDTTS